MSSLRFALGQALSAALAASGGEVKTAILSARANISPEVAREQLAKYNGVLRDALEG